MSIQFGSKNTTPKRRRTRKRKQGQLRRGKNKERKYGMRANGGNYYLYQSEEKNGRRKQTM